MAKPGTLFPTWASLSNYSTGPDVGTPTKIMPSAGEIADGFVPDTAAVPQYMNSLLNLASQWFTYLNGLASDAQFLGNSFHFTGAAMVFDGTLSVGGNTEFNGDILIRGAGSELTFTPGRTYKKMLPLSQGLLYGDAGTFGNITAGGVNLYQSGNANGTSINFHLDLPVGCQLLGTRVGVHSSSIAPSSGSLISCSVSRITYDVVAPTSANTTGAASTDTANNVNVYDILDPVFVAVIDSTSNILLSINGSKDATFADPDKVLWVELEFSHALPSSDVHQ